MKNLVIISESSIVIPLTQNDFIITSFACDFSRSEVLFLSNNGDLLSYTIQDTFNNTITQSDNSFRQQAISSWILSEGLSSDTSDVRGNDNSWFYLSVVAETGAVVCISHHGNIVSIKDDYTTGMRSSTIDHEGEIENGITAAKWNPDQSILLLSTGGNTIIAMTNSWDVLNEISIDASIPNTPVEISWSGDGDFFTTLLSDAKSSMPIARVYNRDFECVSVGRNVAEGDAGVLKGLGSQGIAYATNGSLIALHQIRNPLSHQVDSVVGRSPYTYLDECNRN